MLHFFCQAVTNKTYNLTPKLQGAHIRKGKTHTYWPCVSIKPFLPSSVKRDQRSQCINPSNLGRQVSCASGSLYCCSKGREQAYIALVPAFLKSHQSTIKKCLLLWWSNADQGVSLPVCPFNPCCKIPPNSKEAVAEGSLCIWSCRHLLGHSEGQSQNFHSEFCMGRDDWDYLWNTWYTVTLIVQPVVVSAWSWIGVTQL